MILLAAASLPLSFPLHAQPIDKKEVSLSDEGETLRVALPDGITSDLMGNRDPRVLAAQVMLDRSRHSPGVIDGYDGGNTARAVAAYRQANGLSAEGGLNGELLESLFEAQGGDVFASYTITEDDLAGGFVDIPSDFAEKAKLDRLGYTSAKEMFAERFHMDQGLLEALNPDADFAKAGTKLNVVAKGDETVTGEIARIEVRKKGGEVVALSADGKVIASYPATIGSDQFPSPSGEMTVNAVAPEAMYYFNPEDNDWGPDEQLEIAAGPNNPVGGIWIDLSKDGYGIHGSPDPQWIGKTNSHGCVRLTNWDARELADAVSAGVTVVFL